MILGMQAYEIPMTKQKDHKMFDHLGFRHAQHVKINLNLTSVGKKMEDLEDGGSQLSTIKHKTWAEIRKGQN